MLGNLLLRANEARRIIPGVIATMVQTYHDSVRDASFDIEYEMAHGRPVCGTVIDYHADLPTEHEVLHYYESVPQLTPFGVWLQANLDIIGATLSTIGEEIVWVFGGPMAQWKLDEYHEIDNVMLAYAR